jgi:hypothetical protein
MVGLILKNSADTITKGMELFPVEVDVVLASLGDRFIPRILTTCEQVLRETEIETNETAAVIMFLARRCYRLQEHLTRAFGESDIQYTAWALLELKVFTEYVLQSEGNLQRFIKDAFVDASTAHKVASNSVDAITDLQLKAEGQEILDKVTPELTVKLDEAGVKPSDKYLRAVDIAKQLGIDGEFAIVNTILSKFTHASAISVILPFATEEKIGTACESFLLLGAMNAMHLINRLSGYAKAKGLPSLDAQ